MSKPVVFIVMRGVMRGDGNVCCPATDLDSAWSSQDQANRRVGILRSAGTSAYVVAMQPDAGVLGVYCDAVELPGVTGWSPQ